MDEVFAQSRKFFCLPNSKKMKLLRNEKNCGYTPMLDEILDPENQVDGNLFVTHIYCYT
uniref:Non-haem dioxygenase N-terminal domain-containing protein n=1 Tax=Arundo donax TaxID=35708 RepID=A0A0A9EB35_ARUDO